jgi:hypothetical protein
MVEWGLLDFAAAYCGCTETKYVLTAPLSAMVRTAALTGSSVAAPPPEEVTPATAKAMRNCTTTKIY